MLFLYLLDPIFLIDYAGKLSFSPKKSFRFVSGSNSKEKKKKKADRVRHSGLSERRANSPFSTDCKEISQRLTKILAKLPRVLPTVRSGHVTSLKHSKLLASLLVLLCVVL